MLAVRVGVLLTCGKHFPDRKMLLGGEAWAHKTSLKQPLFIQAPVPNNDSEQSCMCVRDIDLACFYECSIRSWNCSDIVVIFFFAFYYTSKT